jgi:thiol-disulfide isomerase/thioredoxin
MTRTWLVRAAALAGLLLLVVADTSCSTPEAAAASCSKAAPDCKPKLTFVDTAGHAYPPEALTGKVVVVNFWATWCHPCMQEIPSFSRVYAGYQAAGKKDIVMLGVMTDNPDEATLLNFTSDHELLYPIVRADRDILLAFQYPDAIPTTFIYGRSGKLEASHRGPMNDDDLKAQIDKLLDEK